MVNEENLTHHFNVLGYTVENKEVIHKCLDLCDLYQLDEETLVEEWVGYVVSNSHATEESDPTLKSLIAFENAVLKKRETVKKKEDEVQVSEMGKLAATASKLQMDDEHILEMYGYKSTTPSIKRLRSPEHAEAINPESKVRAVESSYSPASYATKTELPKRSDVSITGKVIQNFGNHVESWKNSHKRSITLDKTIASKIQKKPMYMFDILSRRMEISENYCYEMAKKIESHWPMTEGMISTANVSEAIQEPFRTFGRVKCDRIDRFSSGSFILQNWFIPEDGDKEDDQMKQKRGCAVSTSLDLSKLKQFSIFPGEIVVVEGTNPGTDIFCVNEMRSIAEVKPTPLPNIRESMEIIVACGPFTKQDHLDFQPLMSLMQSVAENEPNLLVLVGPFVPHDNEDIKNSVVVDTYQEVFENLIEKITDYIKGSCTQVILIASCEDAHHDNVYPTPEYTIPSSLKHSNIHTVSDPCMISIEGVSIGATSVDILKHLAGKEVNQNMGGSDRVGRLAEHLLHQACFYPLHPPSKDINMDMELWEKYAIMEYRPHILLLPSTLKHFCKWSDNTFILNPGNLSKNLYARLMIHPPEKKWSANCIDCEILKI